MPTRLLLSLCLAAAACGAEDDGLRLVGTVERTLIEVGAPLSEVLAEVVVERGQEIARGALLARLDPTLADAEIARGEAALAAARTGAAVAKIDLQRVQELRRGRVTSQQDLDRAELAEAEAQARMREAEAALVAARKRRADLVLVAPVAGTVDQLPFEPGERVPAGAVIAVLVAHENPWVRVWVPEARFAQVGPGTPAQVRIDGVAGVLRGSVLDVAREPAFTPHYALTERDRVRLVYETRVRILDPPAGLRPGLPAQVEIAARPAEAASVR
jgi:HlyD family secretion protein